MRHLAVSRSVDRLPREARDPLTVPLRVPIYAFNFRFPTFLVRSLYRRFSVVFYSISFCRFFRFLRLGGVFGVHFCFGGLISHTRGLWSIQMLLPCRRRALCSTFGLLCARSALCGSQFIVRFFFFFFFHSAICSVRETRNPEGVFWGLLFGERGAVAKNASS